MFLGTLNPISDLAGKSLTTSLYPSHKVLSALPYPLPQSLPFSPQPTSLAQFDYLTNSSKP